MNASITHVDGRPIAESYWVEPGRLLAGEYPGAREPDAARAKLARLLDAGVDCFVDLTEAGELAPYDALLRELAGARALDVEHHRRPIVDEGVPRTAAEMSAILDSIDAALDTGRTVYVHCWGGVGRTGTVIGCHLARHGLDGNAALREVERLFARMPKSARRRSPENEAQERFVRDWREPPRVPSLTDRAMGALVGLAVGDALGTTLEFRRPGTFTPITDMVGGGPFALRPGEWTDDTSMALCLATSLLECGGFDARDQMRRYLAWWEHGVLSSTGTCFDIGGVVRSALTRYRETGEPYSGPTGEHTAGNGSLMRLAPIPIFFARDTRAAVTHAALSSRTTHGTRTAVDACRYFAALVVAALNGATKEELLAPELVRREELWGSEPLDARVAEIASGSFARKRPPVIRGTGYVVDALEAALWAFHSTDDFRAGALAAVNLGDDADTTGAIYGQLAGAYYGVRGIPREWRERIAMAVEIPRIARALVRAGGGV